MDRVEERSGWQTKSHHKIVSGQKKGVWEMTLKVYFDKGSSTKGQKGKWGINDQKSFK